MATYDLTQNIPSTIETGDILNCPYSGTYKTVTLPAGTYQLLCWGAEGGMCDWSSTYRLGGKGGYSKGTLTLLNPTLIYIYTGGTGVEVKTTSQTGGGFNGGGDGYSHSNTQSVGSGGGASDIRIGSTSLYARVIVAGGGGGAGHDSNIDTDGYGGGTSGGSQSSNSSTDRRSNGGTQTSGGSTTNATYCQSGSFGQGGNGIGQWSSGGGGGWYGGSGGYCDQAGGGSGYVYTSSTSSNYPSGCQLNSTMYLTDAQTIAGNTSIPSTSGSTETGHSGNGYVRVTVVSVSIIGTEYDITSGMPNKLKTGDILKCPYTGNKISIQLPKGTYKLECWGAQGGYRSSSTYGGKGGYSVGTITLVENKDVYLYAGGSGNTGGTSGGFNGGGVRYGYAGGGGASDIRIGQDSLYARVIVAGGGGSDGATSYGGSYGGGTQGGAAGSGCGTVYSGYGTQTGVSGGSSYLASSKYTTSNPTTSASTYAGFGFGGAGPYRSSGYGGAGGGGWYGGGGCYPDGSVDDDRGGCGGSGYIYTSSTASNYPSGCLLDPSMCLTDASMKAGNESMPSTLGSTETGHSGNGFIKISVISVNTDTAFYIKISQNITLISKALVKVSDNWKLVRDIYTKVNGNWIKT